MDQKKRFLLIVIPSFLLGMVISFFIVRKQHEEMWIAVFSTAVVFVLGVVNVIWGLKNADKQQRLEKAEEMKEKGIDVGKN